MALSVNTVWEVRSAGTDTNGGGFVTGSGGTDYSQQNSKNTAGSDISVTNAVGAGSTTITSATANFSTAIVGNLIYLTGGTGSLVAAWYQVISRSSVTTITIDRAVAVGTGITMNIGGALGSIGGTAVAGVLAGNIVYVQAGTFSISTATTNVSGGAISLAILIVFAGYSTNRTLSNTDTKPLFQFGAASTSLFITRGLVYNMAFDGNAQTAARVSGAADSTFYGNCSFTNLNTAAGGGTYNGCSATANSAAVFIGGCTNCEAYANTATPFTTPSSFVACLSYNNTGATTDGFIVAGSAVTIINCSAYGNGRAGFQWNAASRSCAMINCHAENNTTWGFDNLSGAGVGTGQMLVNCSAYNNTSGTISNVSKASISNFITVTVGSVFVSAGTNNFALNNTTNQGALLRAAAFPALFPRGTTASFLDIGAAQHQDTGGGGTTFTGFFIQ